MDDARIWDFEKSLWLGGADRYRDLIDPECRMVLPAEPFVFTGEQAIDAVARSPRWSDVAFSDQSVARPQEGLIVIAYTARARRGEERYHAHCSSTLRRIEQDEWRVVQHQQTPELKAASTA